MFSNQGAVYSLRKQRANDLPRLLQLFYNLTWSMPNVFSAFWLPRDTDMIQLCDLLSKHTKFDSVTISEDLINIEHKNNVFNYKRLFFPFEKIDSLLDQFIAEWSLFKTTFPFDSTTRNMKLSKIKFLISMISLVYIFSFGFCSFTD